MIGTITRDKKNEIENIASLYTPPQPVVDLTMKIRSDYVVGYDILHRSFEEFNDMNLIDRMNIDQKAFNSYTQPSSQDPNEAWRWNGVRPITRNRIISMAAHFVVSTLIPSVFAQNEFDEEDKKAANIMKYLIEYNIRNSDYETSYMFSILAALINPVAYLHTDFSEVMQTIRERNEFGEMNPKEVIDSVFSGFHTHNVPAEEILISNAYEYYLQRQSFIIRRRFPNYSELEARYGNHENFKYVTQGVKAFYSDEDGMFYEQKDDELATLGEELIWYNRQEDMEVPYVNGIYLGKDDVEANLIKHRDNRNHPKYPFAKFGFEPIDEKRFYFYKSAAAKVGPDQDLIDERWRILMDGSFLEGMPAVAGIGTGKLGSDITMPGAVTTLPKDAEIKRVLPPINLDSGFNATREIERSMNESLQDPQGAGREGARAKTAFEVSVLERNMRISLGPFGKMIIGFVKDIGSLLIDIILQHQTIGEIEELLGGETRTNFQTFLLPNQMENGRQVTRKIMFSNELIGKKLTKKQMKKARYKLLDEAGGLDSDTILYQVNPEKFSKLKFMMVLDWEELMPKSFEMAKKLAIYDRAITNPIVDIEAVTRDFLLEPLVKGEADKYIKKAKELGIEGLVSQQRGKTSPVVEEAAKMGILQD